MRHAIVIGRKAGEPFTTIVQPTDPRSASAAFKKLLREPGDLVEIQLWEANVTKRKRFGAAGESGVPTRPARVITVPSLEEVRAVGYIAPGVAEGIVATQKARADALAANPDISDEDLDKIQGPPSDEDFGPLDGLTVVQLRERCAALKIDVSGCVNAADFIAALDLHKEDTGDGPTI